MTIPDIINGSYELLGGIALAGNCVKTFKDKEIKGISLVSMAFFTSWGGWNIYYYPHLHQWMSTVGAVLLFFFNAVWLGQAFYYTQLNRAPKPEPLIEPKVGETRTSVRSDSMVTVTGVDEFSVKYQFPDGRGFRRSKRGFMKNYRPIKSVWSPDLQARIDYTNKLGAELAITANKLKKHNEHTV